MIVDQVVNSIEVGLFHATMMAQMRAANPKANMDAILSRELLNGFQSVFMPSSGLRLAVYYGGDNTRKIMYIDGVATAAQAQALIEGYGPKFLQFPNTGPNYWARDNAPYYQGIMSTGHQQNTEFVDFVGYSAGGVQATVLVDYLRRARDTRKMKLFTFGSPRAGGTVLRDNLSRFPIARWMVPDDPIPLVPPRIDEGPSIAFIAPAAQVIQWGLMVHTQGGVQVDSSGFVSEQLIPTNAQANPVGNLAAWMFSQTGDPNNPHAMTRYIANLTAAMQRYALPSERIVPEAGQEPVENVRKKTVRTERQRILGAIANAQREQFAVPPVEPAFILFTPERIGRSWNVNFGGLIIAQGVHEKTCRHLCRAGNDFLRSLPKQGIVDPISLISQMEQFLGFATDPSSAWAPKLRTEIDFNA